MIQYHLDANVIHVKSILKEMATVSEKILLAGSQGIEAEVRQGVDRIRQLNSDLGSVDQSHTTYFDTRPKTEQLVIANILTTVKKGEEFRRAWAQRYKGIATNEVLIELPDGPGGLIDMALPDSWDWNYDIIAFSNHSDLRLIKSMLERGQKRTMVYCLDSIDESEKIEGVTYFNELKEIDEYLSKLSPNNPSRICIFDKIIELRLSLDENLKEIDEKFTAGIQKGFERSIVNRNTIRVLGKKWISQAVQNMPIIAHQPSFAHISNKLNNMPLAIISPGPSLDKNIEYLKDIQEKAILLAPAQSIIALQKAGIVPDIVMVSDPNDLLYLFEGYDMSRVHALLVGVSCNPELFKKYNKKVISFNVNGPIDSWVSDIFTDDSPKGACGSVSSMAFLLGGILRCDPIILVGQDLSFDGAKQYSKGAADGEVTVAFDENTKTFNYSSANSGFEKIINEMLGKNYTGATTTLAGYYGGKVTTKADYAMFHAEFERIATATKEFDNPPRLLNCTEGGVYINGFEHISLVNAIELLNKNNSPILKKDELFQSVFESVDKQARFTLLKNALNEISQTLTNSVNLAKECHALADKVGKRKADLISLSNKEIELTKQIKTSNFISIAVQDQIRNVLRLSENAITIKQNLGASKLLYKLVIKEAKTMQPYINTAIDDLSKLISNPSAFETKVS